MKKSYTSPELELTLFNADVVSESGLDADGQFGIEWWWGL